MSLKHQEPLPPIVLLVGFDSITDVRRVLALDAPHVEEFFGCEVHYAIVPNLKNKEVWWVAPAEEHNMFNFLAGQPSFSPNKYKKWIESPQFVSHVRRHINHMIHYGLTREGRTGFDQRWHEAVRMVVLTGWISSGSEYVKSIFDGYFQAAEGHYWWWDSGNRKLTPIWRDAEVASIEEAKKPSPAEVLDWPPAQLTGLPRVMQSWAESFPHVKVSDLVKFMPDNLRRRGQSKEDIEQTEQVLKAYGLWLGMIDEEIYQVRRGLVPTTPVRVFSMRLDHGFSDETFLGSG